MTHSKIHIVGFGVAGATDITLEANAILHQASLILVLTQEPGVQEYLTILDRPHRSLLHHYRVGATPETVYTAIAEEVCYEATKIERGSIAVITDGNPGFFDCVTRRIQEKAETTGVNVSILPGISSLDRILIALDIRVENGLQILDTARMIQWGLPVCPHIGCILFQVGGFDLPVFQQMSRVRHTSYHRLRDHLTHIYGADHEIILIRLMTNTIDTASTTIGTFPPPETTIDYRHSAYIPPKDLPTA